MSVTGVVEARIDAALTPLVGLADQIETDGIPASAVPALLDGIRRIERHCAGIGSALAECSHADFEAGHGPPVEQVMGSDGKVPEGQARAEAARVGVLGWFPGLRSSLRAGVALPANVDVLARLLADMTPAEIETLAEDGEQITESAERLGPDSFGRRVRRKRDNIRRDHGMDATRRAKRAAKVSVGANRDRDGYFLNAQFDSEDGAIFLAAYQKSLRRIETELGADHGLSPSELSVRALLDPYLRGVNTTPTFENSSARVVLNVITDNQTLADGPHDTSIAETFDGQDLSPEQLGRLCCDATLRRITTLPDGTVNVSHTGRTATPAQRAALRALYPVCPISGAPWSQLEIHHVIYYSQCHQTALANLVPISRRWHHLVHDKGWKLEMDPDRTIRLYTPDGNLNRTINPPTPINQPQAA